MTPQTIKLALPNKGSLSEPAINLIRNAGYKCHRHPKDLYVFDSENNIEYYFLRPTDIATYVEAQIFDLGITGQDILANYPKNVEEVLPLGFGKSSFYIVAQKDQGIFNPQLLQNKRIASSYPKLVQNFLDEHRIDASIIKLDGAVEIAIRLGIADFIADVVETGITIKQAGLKPWGDAIFHSQATIIKNKNLDNPKIFSFIKRLEGSLLASKYVILEYDIPNDKLKQACTLYPGLESPSIMPLAENSWHAVKIMLQKTEAYCAMDELSKLGAKGILITKIENCRI